ncbi:fucose permease [Paenibacillus sp. PastF-1]|nr:fucose permease [Paenibacillus sp. PastF-2]MDF9849144.1 fucose permease [Paenibacillus sp. PastM-2]MDF9855810.1 fucose permease [Paenibacillus sp. PastF-1]MDH6480986.1 fucose permease [Paenibacillus sp. PastH-2]MDH6508501.1 fucose permease [Paenibacillus sp. PastM-3]
MKQRTTSFNKTYAMQLVTIFLGFIIFGISENIKGPAIPRIQFDFALNEEQLGSLLSLNALGYLIACSFTAILVRKFGIKATSIMSFASMLLSGIFIFVSHAYPAFAASYFLMYIGNGMLEIALAILGARIFVKNVGTMMNLSHFFYGLSSTVAPLIATGMMSVHLFGHELDWRGMYLVMLSLSLLPILTALRSSFPGDDMPAEHRTPFKELRRDPALWWMVLILSFGVVSELAVGGWLVNFLEKAYDWDTVKASGLLSVFFLLFSVGRLVLGPVTDKIGFTLSLIIFSGFSAVCTFAAIAGGESLAFLFAAAGLGIAMIYPTVMAFIAKRYPNGSDTAITFTVTMMGLGSVIGNYVIGFVIEAVKKLYGDNNPNALLHGLQAGYGFIGLCALLCAVCAFVLYRFLNKRGELI